MQIASCFTLCWEKFLYDFSLLDEKNTCSRCYANGLGKWKLKLHLKHVNDIRGKVIKSDNLNYSRLGNEKKIESGNNKPFLMIEKK